MSTQSTQVWKSVIRYLSLALLFAISGCVLPPATKFKKESYLLSQRMYTFAIYNDDGRLVSDPLFDLQKEVKPSGLEPITDLYIIAHGWNFTLQESITNYHNYMELIDTALEPLSAREKFRPFAIFVTWPSVSRPLGDLAKAVLPFGLDTSIGLVTSAIDSTVFFLPSAWKQSLNAFTVAIGKKQPDSYFIKNRSQGEIGDREFPACEPVLDAEIYGVDASIEQTGRDCPVSALLFTLIKWNELYHHSQIRIHIIGHSYGAKLATLATVEALRRWELDSSPFNYSEPPPFTDNHGYLCGQKPIESLVLFNAAFNPREIVYLSRSRDNHFGAFKEVRVSPVPYLQCIPRKALVYSRRDHATGGLFNAGQLLMDNRSNTYSHQVISWEKDAFTEAMPTPSMFSTPGQQTDNALIEFAHNIAGAVQGTLSLASAVVVGPMTWVTNTLLQLPEDFIWHIRENNSLIQSSPDDETGWIVGRGLANTVDFFIPVSHFYPFIDNADRMGLLRSTTPGLGNTGLDKLEAGRTWTAKLTGDDWTELLDETYGTTDQGPSAFCKLSSNVNTERAILDSGEIKPTFLYSFNGSLIMDTLWSPSGAHGDLRSKDTISNCDPSIKNDPALQKRQAIYNFVINFTKGQLQNK